jgi:HK97 family phage portal protein
MSFMGALHARAERRAVTVQAGTLEQPTESFVLGAGVSSSSSGVSVTQRSAEGIPTVFACNRVISQDVAKAPIEVKTLSADGSRKIDRTHPAYPVLHDAPNSVMTDYEFKETLQGYLNLWGNGYAEIIRHAVSTNVTPKRRIELELWPLDSARMTVDLDPLNRLRYSYQMQGIGQPKTWIFDPMAPPIFHLRQNSRDGIVGRGPVQVLREAMGTTIAQDRYVGRLYGQGGHPRVALSTSQKLTDTSARRIRSDFETLTVGEHNWHRVVVLDHDLKPVPLVMPNRDAQFLQLVQLSDMRLCGAFRISPHKIANLERATFSNIEMQSIEHVGDCLMPNFICWQKAIARDILNPISYGTHVAMFDVDELMRGDSAAMGTALAAERQNGVISANGWLRRLGRDDQISDEDGGNLYLVNGNMMPMRRDPAASLDMPLPVPHGGAN